MRKIGKARKTSQRVGEHSNKIIRPRESESEEGLHEHSAFSIQPFRFLNTARVLDCPWLNAECWSYNALILARNSLLPLVLLSLSISNSIASTGESGFSTLRKTQMRCRSSFGISSSSLRVPER